MVISKLSRFVSKHFNLVLFITVCISYGQMLGMYIWKDDNAIFFKFDHLAEPAGYLGRGLLGEGPYRLSVAPYWFIYKLFGNTNLVPYYILLLVFYYFAALAVYNLFTVLVSPKAGKYSAIVFAVGYIASEGFYWMASSWILSVSIILTSLLVQRYYLLLQKQSFRNYAISFITYLSCIVITPVRTHYVIGLLLIMEIFWGVKWRQTKSIYKAVLRLIPFVGIFYFLYIVGADSRTASLSTYFEALKTGHLYLFYSFFATSGNIFLTDFQSKYLFAFLHPILVQSIGSFIFKISIMVIGSLLLSKYSTKRGKLLRAVFFALGSLVWIYISKVILLSPQINLIGNDQYLLFIGGEGLLFWLTQSFFTKKGKLYLFLIIWFSLNLAVYTSYIPTGYYASIDRYLAHSFVALAGILGLYLSQRSSSRLFIGVIILWIGTNLIGNVINQHSILIERSIPSKRFYTELRKNLPSISKGDQIYIDVADENRGHFSSAFSVGQMPESTALAWRYGVDRYDFLLLTDYSQTRLTAEQKNEYKGNIHTFFFGDNKILNTTDEFLELTKKGTSAVLFNVKSTSKDLHINFTQRVSSVRELTLTLSVSAKAKDSNNITFPLIQMKNDTNTLASDSEFRRVAYDFMNYKDTYRKLMKISPTSEWQDRVIENIKDENTNTVWQPDRIKWHDGLQGFTVDLTKNEKINRVVWKNGFENNSPTKYEIYTSLNGNTFTKVLDVNSVSKIPSDIFIENIFSEVEARYVKVVYKESLNDDAPGIAEFMPIPSRFSKYQISSLEFFLDNPFNAVLDSKTYIELLNHFSGSGKVGYSWKTNKSAEYKTAPNKYVRVNYDSHSHKYKFIIPAGGTELTDVVLNNKSVPGDLKIESATVEYE